MGAELREAGPVGGRTDVGVTAVGGGDETGRGGLGESRAKRGGRRDSGDADMWVSGLLSTNIQNIFRFIDLFFKGQNVIFNINFPKFKKFPIKKVGLARP